VRQHWLVTALGRVDDRQAPMAEGEAPVSAELETLAEWAAMHQQIGQPRNLRAFDRPAINVENACDPAHGYNDLRSAYHAAEKYVLGREDLAHPPCRIAVRPAGVKSVSHPQRLVRNNLGQPAAHTRVEYRKRCG